MYLTTIFELSALSISATLKTKKEAKNDDCFLELIVVLVTAYSYTYTYSIVSSSRSSGTRTRDPLINPAQAVRSPVELIHR